MPEWMYFVLGSAGMMVAIAVGVNVYFWIDEKVKANENPKFQSRVRVFKWVGISLVAGFAIIAMNNPTIREFNDFIEVNTIDCNCDLTTGRVSNYLIFSEFEFKLSERKKRIDPIPRQEGKYYGFFRNFYLVHSQIIPVKKR